MNIELFSSISGTRTLETLMAEFRARGHAVRMVSVLPDEEYRRRKSRLGHLWMRWLMYGWFPVKTGLDLLRAPVAPGTVRLTVTAPFYAPALVRWLSGADGVPTLCLLYDLFPDALIAAGTMRSGTRAAKLVAAVTRFGIQRSALTIYLGAHLMSYGESVYGPSRRPVVIPVGADGAFCDHLPTPAGPEQRLRLIYAGALGRMHDVETVRELLSGDLPAGVDFHFHASGVAYEALKRDLAPRAAALGERVVFQGPLPDDAWKRAMAGAQLALVTMIPGAEKVVFPSKAFSALMAGQAIVAVCPRDSDLADLVRAHDCGWQVAPGDVAALRRVLTAAVTDPALLQQKRMNGYRAGHQLYDLPVIAERILREAATLRAP